MKGPVYENRIILNIASVRDIKAFLDSDLTEL